MLKIVKHFNHLLFFLYSVVFMYHKLTVNNVFNLNKMSMPLKYVQPENVFISAQNLTKILRLGSIK